MVLLILANTLFMIIPDSFGSSIRSLQYRYFLPCFLGIQLSVSYLLGYQINNLSLKFWQQKLWQLIFLALLSLGIISGLFIAQDRDWGLDDQRGTASSLNLQLVPSINQSERPLVISSGTPSFILALSHLTEPKVKFRLFNDKNPTPWENNINLSEDVDQFSDIFIIYPNEKLLNLIEKNQEFQRTSIIENKLYKAEKRGIKQN